MQKILNDGWLMEEWLFRESAAMKEPVNAG
jgi:hypothetical protein